MVRKPWIRLRAAPASCRIPLLLLALYAQPLSGQDGFRVIVHVDNPTSSVQRSFVSKAFLKKVDRWDDGTRIAPVDLGPDSRVRQEFSARVHRRDLRAVLGFWQRQIFSGKDIPPLEVAGDDEAIAYVRSHVGGIGYVSAGARLEGVKVLRMTDLSAATDAGRGLSPIPGADDRALASSRSDSDPRGRWRVRPAGSASGTRGILAAKPPLEPARGRRPGPTLDLVTSGRWDALKPNRPLRRHARPEAQGNQPSGTVRGGAQA